MYIVDRIEGSLVVLEKEDKSFIDRAIELFPAEIKAGDVVYEEKGRFFIHLEETKKRSEKIKKLMDDLWED